MGLKLVNISKMARTTSPTRLAGRLFDPRRDVYNMVGAVEIKGMLYFDINIVRTNWRRINQSPITKAGNLVRYLARRSIRDVSARQRAKPSPRGTPPRSRRMMSSRQVAGKGGESRPFKMIYSVPDITHTQVYVGMVGFRTAAVPVPGLHEHGGRATRSLITNEKSGRRVTVRVKKDRQHKAGLKTVYLKKKTATYPLRPFMTPALLKATPQLPFMWKDSLGRI